MISKPETYFRFNEKKRAGIEPLVYIGNCVIRDYTLNLNPALFQIRYQARNGINLRNHLSLSKPARLSCLIKCYSRTGGMTDINGADEAKGDIKREKSRQKTTIKHTITED